MVEFGKRLLATRLPMWSHFYLDYNELKASLKRIVASFEFDIAVGNDDSSSLTRDAKAFEALLDREIEKVVLFFLNQQGIVAKHLWRVRETTKDRSRKELLQEYVQIGEELVLLVNFVELNVTGLRKILKKCDKTFHRSTITKQDLVNNAALKQTIEQMYHFGGISALTETLRKAMIELEGPTPVAAARPTYYSKMKKSASWVMGDVGEEVEPILLKIQAARRRLQQSHGSLYAQSKALIFDEDSEENESVHLYSDDHVKKRSSISTFLNLMSSFLFMTNYYIVAPTSGTYAARLGMSEALSGLIIGMTPCAALIASVLYSWWSNHSYKSALLFSAGCAILGDIFYALALPFNSVAFIFMGRLLNGFGGARAVNRRYIADAFSRDERTAASAAFVTSSALGMAAGPALAVAGDYFTSSDPLASNWWTVETAPGYIMFLLWSTYFVVCWFFFEEPERKNLGHHCNAANAEMMRLLNGDQMTTENTKTIQPLWKNVPAMASLVIYFVLKWVLECLMSSTATITTYYFHWNVSHSGVFLSILGLLMFPANMVVAHLSRTFEDRTMILGTQCMMLIGTIGIISYSTTYTVFQYIGCYIIIFLGANMLEGPNMALLSKTLPKRWAKGTFNSGLLATEAGTFGRVVGDFVISAAGIVALDRVLDLTFIPTAVLVGVTLLVCCRLYPQLQEIDEDDE
jgi:MFS family permease